MRMKQVEIDRQTGVINVNANDFDKPVLIVVSEGKVKQTELPIFGETKIVTHQGKVKRVNYNEGEEF